MFRHCRHHMTPTPTNIYLIPFNTFYTRKAQKATLYRENKHTHMATSVQEVLAPPLDSKAEQPPLFDGTTRLYTAYHCPFAQRVWITRNYKGLQDKIKLVPLNLHDRPAWYKEKVYPENKVPSLEHNGKIVGESLDLINYVNENFEGPSLFPDDPAKREFGLELLSYTNTFNTTVFTSFKGDAVKESAAVFDYLENALHKFDDGPFFLGQFSSVDIAYIPFVERFQNFFSEVFKYDFTSGRPKLAAWIEELNKIDAYKQTVRDPKEYLEYYKKRFLPQPQD
ncbi:GST_C_2 domain-containing protein/GST_N_3 domain-containing protein [Cephalotus follicularis]|uniref:glutathione transferase n=1 Tax=Cephalotus follicularis TaxID=3775 RepID=A0A1Q3CVE1_CEPFO|nr:GST_C_2 domain-containing protein/GST_N_3 domain-containing protein [Cephalotus follicularis]